MSVLRAAWLVAVKDLQLEIRTKEILTSTGLFAVLVVTLGSLAFYTDPVSSPTSHQACFGFRFCSAGFS